MRLRCRPLQDWSTEFSRTRRNSAFSAAWKQTMNLLERELDRLGAENGVIELAVAESDIRLDGWPYAHARPAHPGVIVSFDSTHGPLRYGTDAFPDWQENVRAIALGLEALRKVDRYGIGKRGEQYTGWKQLGSGDAQLAERGIELIQAVGGEREALKHYHPDHGGSREDFAAVQAARASLAKR